MPAQLDSLQFLKIDRYDLLHSFGELNEAIASMAQLRVSAFVFIFLLANTHKCKERTNAHTHTHIHTQQVTT